MHTSPIVDLVMHAAAWPTADGGVIVEFCRDDAGAGLPGRDQLRDQLGRMLEIRVHHDHGAPARVARRGAAWWAEIARKRNVANRGVARRVAESPPASRRASHGRRRRSRSSFKRHHGDRGRRMARNVAGLVVSRRRANRDFGRSAHGDPYFAVEPRAFTHSGGDAMSVRPSSIAEMRG